MKEYKEKVCKNWFMKKSGKRWVFGCALVTFGVFLLEAGPVVADEVAVDSAGTQVTEVSAVVPEKVPASGTVTETASSEEKLGQPAAEAATAPAARPASEKSDETGIQDQPKSAAQADHASPAKAEAGSQKGFKTNLSQGQGDSKGIWEIRDQGLYSDARDKGDSFYYTQSQGKNFVFQTEVTFLEDRGAASLVFRANNVQDDLKAYVVNLDGYSKKAKVWRWAEANLLEEKEVAVSPEKTYTLKVVAADGWLSYYINDKLVGNLGDFTIQRNDMGQTTYIPEGYFGLLNWNGKMIFQNTFFKELTDGELPYINDVTVTSKTGKVEAKGQFFPKEATHIQYVSNAAETVDLSFVKHNSNAMLTVSDSKGRVYANASDIPIEVGANYLTVTSSYTTPDGYTATLTYRINVHRRQPEAVYYNENYRDQYHYSVKDGWANDPNGMVYYKGKYHLFYQFFDDTSWGPMHWMHATSTDLLHWEEKPMAFYPDYNGTMFSGAMVVDEHNTSGLFDGPEGGLVALITVNGEGQRIKLAYSKDEGKTWTKVDQIAADWTNDPLKNRDFRDPKVFRWEDKWFMVVAGGPLRIYSSDNLLEWKPEAVYPDLHTECPDLYPIEATDGQIKWVLSRGGRFYKVGDFKTVDGKWTFDPDKDYQDQDGVMNFGKDSYAAMTYYVQDFGNSKQPKLPKLVEINWMNTWDDYCRIVAEKTGQKFNGTFNLNLVLGLTKDGEKYVLTQTPHANYDSLRDTEKSVIYNNITVGEDNNLFKDFQGDTYEIVSHFTPVVGTQKIGFNLRVGDGKVTKVIYNLQTEELSIDRSQSGVILTEKFREVNKQKVTRNADGSIDLHIYVDRSSVEVFAKGDTVAGANQIFPAPNSLGLGVFVEGQATKADIALYPIKSVWTNKQRVDHPLDVIAASEQNLRLNVGDNATLTAYIMPAQVAQGFLWSVSDPTSITYSVDGNNLNLQAVKEGKVTVRASAKENPSLYKEFNLNILRNDFKTNLPKMLKVAGNWYVDGESLRVTNQAANDAYMTKEKLSYGNYQLDLDIKYPKGVVNLFFASEKSDPAQAYAIQFGDQKSVRLFRFYGNTIAEAPLVDALNDGRFHHVRLIKTENKITVLVDGQEVMNHIFDTVDDYFNAPYIGLGLWDGELEARNIFVTALQTPAIQKQELQKVVEVATAEAGSGFTQPTPKPLATASMTEKLSSASLPKTGAQNSALLSFWGLGVLGIASLAFCKNKKEE